jgi:hypothetical protein
MRRLGRAGFLAFGAGRNNGRVDESSWPRCLQTLTSTNPSEFVPGATRLRGRL